MPPGPNTDVRTIRVLAFMEASTVTGPAKNLIEFAIRAAVPAAGVPAIHMSVATYLRGGQTNAFVAALQNARIPVYALHERRRFDGKVLPEIRRVVAESEPDIIQTHNIKSHFYVRLLGLHRQRPWIAFNHGYTAVDWKDRLYANFDRWSLRAAHRVVALCGPFADMIAARGVERNRIRVQHNSVKPFERPEDSVTAALRASLKLREETVILSAGRLSAEKAHADLLRAAALVGDTPPFHLVIAGGGPEYETLQELIRQLRIEGKVTLAGHQTDLRSYYAIADILALPSHSEGSPNVVLEGMAAGIPIAATMVGGVPEILEDGKTGLLVPARSPHAMAAALQRLLNDSALRARLGTAGREHAYRLFTPEAYTISLARFYAEAADSFTGSPGS